MRVVIKNINLILAKGTTQIEAQKQHCSMYKAKNFDVHVKNGSRNVKKKAKTLQVDKCVSPMTQIYYYVIMTIPAPLQNII